MTATSPLRELSPRSPSEPTDRTRREIQALRAIAVLGVLLFHLWPLRLPGGYVGVDVFFVVSGFLISDHLLRELDATGRLSLPRFWARRARRLLPASLLVLTSTAAAVYLFVPETRWAQFGGEIMAAAAYVENWTLAAQSVDYMALANLHSPVQHFWSLSVEEQFYIVWPLLVVAAVAIGALLHVRRAIAIVVFCAAVSTASIVYSVVLTWLEPSVAYFSTFTRAWEFAAGMALALLLRRIARPFPPTIAAVASWLGLAMIATAMLTFSPATPFPSFTAALPVLGTMVVIAAGTPAPWWAPTGPMSLRPVQFVGDVSYGTYLWHWPIIVLVPFATGHPLGTITSGLIFVLSVALGWASKRFVEDPVRRHPAVARGRSSRVLLTTTLGIVLVVGVATPAAAYRITPPPVLAEQDMPPCYGAKAAQDSSCGDPRVVPLVARLSSFAVDIPAPDILACEYSVNSHDYRRCDYGDLSGDGPHVALIGDSHATRLVASLRTVILGIGGSLSTFTVSGCSMMSRELTGSVWGYDAAYAEECRRLSTEVHDEVASDDRLATVILNDRTRLYVSDDPAVRPLTAPMVIESITRLQDADKVVVIIEDPPEMRAVPLMASPSAVDCLGSGPVVACDLPVADAAFDDPMSAAATATGVAAIDLDDLFCDRSSCHAQIGGLVVYSDDNHITASFASSMVGALRERLLPALAG